MARAQITSSHSGAMVSRRRAMQSSFTLEGCEGPYRDYAATSVSVIKAQMQAPESKRKGPRGGVSEPFPVKLYDMLDGVEREGLQSIVSWAVHGRCFHIHAAKAFVDEIMPHYFKQSKLTSFQRQLNLYGFQRVASGRDRGAYYHALFLRGRPDISKIMLRTRVKGGAAHILEGEVASSDMTLSFYDLVFCAPSSLPTVSDHEDDSTSTGSPLEQSQHPMEQQISLQQEPHHRMHQDVRPNATVSYVQDQPSFYKHDYSPQPQFSLHSALRESYAQHPTQSYQTQTQPPPLCDLTSSMTEFDLFMRSDDDETGFFEGRTFRFMDDENLQAFESSLSSRAGI